MIGSVEDRGMPLRVVRRRAVGHLEGDRRRTEVPVGRREGEGVVVDDQRIAVGVGGAHRARVGEPDLLAAERR